MTLESLHEATKVPLELLREFEETGLFDHPMFNRVYLRSLIRAYADTVGIPPHEALSALDLALAGTYKGELTHTDEAPVPEAEADTAAPAEDEEATPQKTPPPVAEREPDVRTEAPKQPPPDEPPSQKKPDRPLRESRPAPETLSAANWETQLGRASSQSKPIDLGRQTQLVQWGLIGLVVLVLAGAVWGVLALIGGGSDDPVAAQEATTTDTTAVEDTTATAPPASEQPAFTIGDTLDVVVLAETGKVQGIRITQDDDLRRPYWIEEGNSKAFPVLNRIVLEQEQALENIKLLVEGHPYPTNRRDEEGRIVITRETVQAFADSLSGTPVNVDSTIVERVTPPSSASE